MLGFSSNPNKQNRKKREIFSLLSDGEKLNLTVAGPFLVVDQTGFDRAHFIWERDVISIEPLIKPPFSDGEPKQTEKFMMRRQTSQSRERRDCVTSF